MAHANVLAVRIDALGLHFALAPHDQAKLSFCQRLGRDVIGVPDQGAGIYG